MNTKETAEYRMELIQQRLNNPDTDSELHPDVAALLDEVKQDGAKLRGLTIELDLGWNALRAKLGLLERMHGKKRKASSQSPKNLVLTTANRQIADDRAFGALPVVDDRPSQGVIIRSLGEAFSGGGSWSEFLKEAREIQARIDQEESQP